MCVIISIFGLSFFLNLESCNHKKDLSISPNNEIYRELNSVDNFEEDDTEFALTYNGKIWKFKAKDFYTTYKQFDINYEFNKFNINNNKNKKIILINKLKKLNIENEKIIEYLFPGILKNIKKIQNNIEKQAKNAEIYINNKINITKEKNGIKIDFNKFYELFFNYYINNNKFKLEIPVVVLKPEIRYDELRKSTNFRASFSTSFSSSSQERKHNISQASKKLNGIKLSPNEKFFFNKVVGQRTKENGFKMAKIISNGEFVDGVGGGVCQVSTTLYNAVLKSGLKIIQANKHSEKVSYIKTGFDAMVNYGSSDLIFENNTKHDIYILSETRANTVTIKVFGESMGNYRYELKNEIYNKSNPNPDKIIIDTKGEYLDKVKYEDESFYLKRAKEGFYVKSFRETYFNNQLIKTELLRTDKYNSQQGVKIVGAEKRDASLS